MIYFTSDLHFGHDKDFVYAKRGYESIEQHDADIIRKWNETVNDDDIIYVLGDLTLGDYNVGREKLSQLKGNIKYVIGNHDTIHRLGVYDSLGFECLGYSEKIKYGKYKFYLSHYPTFTGNYDDLFPKQMVLNLFGHTHQKDKFYNDIKFMYNVGIDAHGGDLVSIDTIIEDIKNKFKEYRI